MQEVHLEESPAEQQQLGFVQAKETQREALVQEALKAVGTFPSSASSPCGLCSPAPTVLSFQIQGLLDISSLSPEPRPSPAWQRAGNTQAQGLKGSQGDSRAPAGGRAGDEGGRPQRAPQQHWKESRDALAHLGTLPGLSTQMSPPAALGTQEAGE